MDKFQFMVSVFLILLKCEELTMQHLTFSNTTKSWKDAVKHCSGKGGVLESNVTLLKEQHEFKNANEGDEVWIGKFRTLTNWTYIRGCFLINGNLQHFELELFNTAELRIQCQVLCNNYKFYSTKKADCYCIANISSFVRSKNCNCVGCYKVWEHQLPSFHSEDRNHKCIATISCDGEKFKRGSEKCNDQHDKYKVICDQLQDFDSNDGNKKCIASTSCDGDKFKRGYKKCDHRENKFRVICDNDAYLGYNYVNYQDAADQCERKDSFIKWNSKCNSTKLPEYWTSGTRHYETFVIRKAYFTENLEPKKCFSLKKNGGEEEKKNCDDDFRFFCRFETDEDEGNMISIPNLSTPPQKRVQSDDSGNIAAGIVTSIIVVIAVISVLVFIYLRRIHSRDLLSLSTIVKDEPSPSRMDSNTANAAYEQLNKTDKDNISHCQSYDQLIVHEADKTNKHNTRISSEDESKYESIDEPIKKYHNALPAEYEQLEQSEIVKTTNVYDPLHYTPLEDPDPTNARSNNIVSREVHRKYGTGQTGNETHTNVVPLEYEQLDIKKTDTSTKAYDQLHVIHHAGNESTNDCPQLIVSGGKHTNNESSKYKKEYDSRIVSPEYEQLDITEQVKRTKTYD